MAQVAIERYEVHDASSPAAADVIARRADTLHQILSLVAEQGAQVEQAIDVIVQALAHGKLVLACGNGGSAADAQHLVGELVGRFLQDREPWPAIALTTDSSVLTSISNDYGFDHVFQRQVAAFGQPGGVFIGFSTSGESRNVLNAAREARRRGMQVVAFTGQAPSSLSTESDIALTVPVASTPLVQEVHGVLLHVVCDMVESALVNLKQREESVA
jgi:D-sedoheptulose 7-phosphate isomerase